METPFFIYLGSLSDSQSGICAYGRNGIDARETVASRVLNPGFVCFKLEKAGLARLASADPGNF